jgi:hypothetical protein
MEENYVVVDVTKTRIRYYSCNNRVACAALRLRLRVSLFLWLLAQRLRLL